MICGSTVVVLLLAGNKYILLSVGDSRCYRFVKKTLRTSLVQLTCDETDKQTGKLINAVGVKIPLKCSVSTGEIKTKQRFILCSDGIYKYCKEKEIVSILKKIRDDELDIAGNKIKDLVYSNGAGDNLSVIIISVKSE